MSYLTSLLCSTSDESMQDAHKNKKQIKLETEFSFTLFGALKVKNIIYKWKKTTTNGKRHTNKFMVTVSHVVATPLVVENNNKFR